LLQQLFCALHPLLKKVLVGRHADRLLESMTEVELTMCQFWNANTHYHSLVLASLPPDASRVLDVGCGDGILSAELFNARVPDVVGLDVDRFVLDRARARHKGMGIEWVQGDVLKVAFEPESFDAVVSVAALHHMDAAQSLKRFAQLVRPGGTVIAIGLAASAWSDIPLATVASIARWVLGLVHGRWNHSAPECWPPPLTYREMKALSARVLPGVGYRRHLLGRYSLVWRKP
jgi:2-polyprenyl-3-methyl-5-hydroxy-6-metoxy-1,4-benzoquinol methylase